MCLLSVFYPDEIKDSAYEIDYEGLYESGIRGLIYDIDNTLVEHGFPADERAIRLFERLKSIGFKITLFSNNKEARVKMFNDSVNVNYIHKAGKPLKKGYTKAMNMMGTDLSSTLFIGDQLFTDIFGAKLCNMKNILVKPIDPHEEIQIVLKRKLEAIVLFFYLRRKKNEN